MTMLTINCLKEWDSSQVRPPKDWPASDKRRLVLLLGHDGMYHILTSSVYDKEVTGKLERVGVTTLRWPRENS